MENRACNLFFISSLAQAPQKTELVTYGSTVALLHAGFAMLILRAGGDEELEGIIEAYHPETIAGDGETITRIACHHRNAALHARRMMDADKTTIIRQERHEGLCRLGSIRDFLSLFSLLDATDMLPADYDRAERQQLASFYAGKPFPAEAIGLKLDGRLVSAAYTAMESRLAAQIVGVATLPALRSRGYASAVVSELADVLLNEDRLSFIALACSSEESHRLYSRLGFADAGELTYIRL